MFRVCAFVFGFLLPWSLRRYYLNYMFGFKISAGARIGYSLVIPKVLKMMPGARIGHLTVVKGLDNLSMDSYALLGNLNWVSGFPSGNDRHFTYEESRNPSLVIGEHAAITNRHLIDCTDLVSVGKFSTFAGFRSQILTHSIDIANSRQGCKPVVIGDYSFVGTGAVILGGAVLPAYSVLGAGALLNSGYDKEYCLYGGVPAKLIGDMPRSCKYFSRSNGFVL